MRKLIPLLMVAILALCSACADKNPPAPSNTSTNVSSTKISDEIMVGARQEVGDFSIELKSYRITQTRVWTTDYDIIVISYEWTNNSGGPRSFEGQFQHYAFQNGIACKEHLFAVDEAEIPAANDPWREVQTGKTQAFQKAYELLDTTSDVDIEIGTRDGYLAHTIVIDSTKPSQSADTSGASETSSPEPNVFVNVLDEYINDATYTDCAYALYDIDGNGVDELLVRYNDGDDCTKLYTYADGKTNVIGEYWPRYRLMLDGNGNLYAEGSGGASHTTIELMRISDDGTALITTEAWEMDGSIYSHNSIDGRKAISEKEFFAAWDSISDATEGVVDSLNWQPLSSNKSDAGSESSYPGEPLYKGEPIMNWMGASLPSLRDVFGNPDVEGTVAEGGAYGYAYGSSRDMIFVKAFNGDYIEVISGAPSSLSVNGIALDTNRDQLISLLGEPETEAWSDNYGEEAYYMCFVYQEKYSISFYLDDPNGKAYDFWII